MKPTRVLRNALRLVTVKILRPLKERLQKYRAVKWLTSYLFGDDIFISYSRDGGIAYAEVLARKLSSEFGYSCRLDLRETLPGRRMPKKLLRGIQRCRMLVVIATERAAGSQHVHKEIKLYKRTHRGNISIITVDFGGTVLKALWFSRIDGLPPGPNESAEALHLANPSEPVIQRIHESFDFTRRNWRLFLSSVASLVLLLTLLTLSLVASAYATVKTLEATNAIREETLAKQAAEQAKGEVLVQQKAAAEAKDEADKQRSMAEYQARQAQEQKALASAANEQRATAEKATQVARRLEEEAKKEATRQQKTAESQRLTADAIESLPVDPGQSLRKATEALNTWQTEAAVNTLRRSLHAYRVRTIMGESEGNIISATFSHDGNLLVTIGPKNVARVRDVNTGRVISELHHTEPVLAAAFSPDGKLIVTGSKDNTACVWEALSGKRVAQLTEHNKPVTSVAFSPTDDNLVATDSPDSLLLWNIASKKSLKLPVPEGSGLFTSTLAFSPDGELIAVIRNTPSSGARNAFGSARICEVRTQKCAIEVSNPTGLYTSIAFDRDSKRLLIGSQDGTVQMWDISGKLLFESKDHTGTIWSVSFSPDNRYAVTTSGGFSNEMKVGSADDFSPRVWDSSTGKLVAILRGHINTVLGAAFSPDSKFIVTASWDKTAGVWEAATGRLLTRLTGHKDVVNSAVFSPDGRLVLTASGDGTARMWDPGIGRVMTAVQGQRAADLNIKFTPDGKNVVIAKDSKTVKICPLEIGECRDERRNSAELLFKSELRPNGAYDDKYRIEMLANGTARVINEVTNQIVTKLEKQISSGPYLSPFRREFNPKFSLDGTRLLTAREDFTAQVWEVGLDSSRLVSVLPGHRGVLNDGNFSPDGESVVLASGDGTARVYKVSTGTLETVLIGHKAPILSASFSSNGEYIVTTSMSGAARVWKAKTGELVSEMEGHFNWVQGAAFSPDARLVVTAGRDNTARIWETRTGKVIAIFQLQMGNEFNVAFSPDAQRIATASDEGIVRLYSCEVCGSIKKLLDTALNRMP